MMRAGQRVDGSLNQGMSMNSPLMELQEMSRSFGRQIILREADLTVAEGEIISVLGVNGAGKTTLLRIMAG
ncbi:MAG: ATP-binding cassette domain-containing protein, partial [Verrucomicrobiales bacterium]